MYEIQLFVGELPIFAGEVLIFFAAGNQEPAKDFESLAKDALEAIQPAIEEIPMTNLCQNWCFFFHGTSIVEIIFNGASIHFFKMEFYNGRFLSIFWKPFSHCLNPGICGKTVDFCGTIKFSVFLMGQWLIDFMGKRLIKYFRKTSVFWLGTCFIWHFFMVVSTVGPW